MSSVLRSWWRTVIWARYPGESEIRHRWYENTGLKTDWNLYLKAIERAVTGNTTAVMLCNPGNPTGTMIGMAEIERLAGKVQEKGLTVVPLSVFVEGNWIKVEIALVRGKQLHDKRDTLRQRTLDREAEQAMKERGR